MSGQNPGQQGGGDVLICPHYGTEYARRNICGLCRLSAAQGAGGPRPAIYMTGGPSGAGKDTLLLGAREALTTKPGGAAVEFLKREITRDPSKTTDLEIPVSVAEFEAHAAAGQYALDWAAHSTQYAIPEHELECAAMVNAAGPWVDNILSMANGRAPDDSRPARQNVRLVQGSHIVVPRLYEHDRCYTFQNPDGRVLFAIPYERHFTLIGTTDRDFSGTPDHVSISEDEVSYLCAATSAHFKKPTAPGDVVWSYSAVRPLYNDGSSKAQDATRDYVLTEDGENAEAKLINIFGGKITTYRRLAEEVLGRIDNALGRTTASWSAVAPLPGGNFARDETDAKLADLVRAYPFLRPPTAQRLFRQYGTLATDVLGDANSWSDLGRDFGASLSEREVRYLQSMEWAQSAEDILWRRSKLGLRMQAEAQARLSDFLERNPL